MNELNSGKIKITNDGNIIMQFSNYHHVIDSDTELYYKHQADKVIAELKSDYKEACERLQTANLIKDEQLAATRHQKYKRCLAMAKWCKAEQDAAFLRYNWDTGRYYDVDFYEKWHKRWLELAEKFKEEK